MKLEDITIHNYITDSKTSSIAQSLQHKVVVSSTKARNEWLIDNKVNKVKKLFYLAEGKTQRATSQKVCDLSEMLEENIDSNALINRAIITEQTYYLPREKSMAAMRSALTEQLGDEQTAAAVADYISQVFEDAAIFEKPRKPYMRKSSNLQE